MTAIIIVEEHQLIWIWLNLDLLPELTGLPTKSQRNLDYCLLIKYRICKNLLIDF